MKKRDRMPTPQEVHDAMEHKKEQPSRLLRDLCRKVEKLPGGRKLFSRELAEWWAEHRTPTARELKKKFLGGR